MVLCPVLALLLRKQSSKLIEVINIVAGDLALCKVKKGSADIYTALEEIISIKETDPNNAHDLIVESKSFK